jgi:LysR family glycine cleavage system transcriptional activator
MRRKIPATHTLLCFEAAARHASYTRAAQELSLTQSAVSRQVALLEEFIGQPLFQRARHGVTLTPRGAEYARQVATLLQSLERDTLDAMSGQGAGGAIALAAVPTFAARWLIPRLPAFQALHPDVVVHIDTRTRPFLFSDTPFDAAIHASTRSQIRQWAGTQAQELMPEVVIPVCAPSLLVNRPQLEPSELAQHTLLQQSTRPDAWRLWFEAAGLASDQASAVALTGPRFEQFSMTAAAAAAGLGVALVPRLLIETELARGELVQAHPLALPEERHYFLVLPDTEHAKPALQRFVGWVVGVAVR